MSEQLIWLWKHLITQILDELLKLNECVLNVREHGQWSLLMGDSRRKQERSQACQIQDIRMDKHTDMGKTYYTTPTHSGGGGT